MHNLNFILAQNSDASEIWQLLDNCRLTMINSGIMQWDDVYPAKEFVIKDIARDIVWNVKDNDKIIGVITIEDFQPPQYSHVNWHITTKPCLVVYRLAVLPVAQKKGIGKALMGFAEDFAGNNGFAAIRLDAYSGNPAAIALYKNLGYKECGSIMFPRRQLPFICFEKEIIQNSHKAKP